MRTDVLKPAVPATPGTVNFVELLLRRHGTVVDRNVYWLPATPDVIDWDTTLGNPQATMTSYADLTALTTTAPRSRPIRAAYRCWE